jgi:nucleoside-diphosphate-sugar epimerase
MKRALITGGVGFIGSHMVRKLADASMQVTIADRRATHESPILRGISGEIDCVLIDLRDAQETGKLINSIRPDVVLHLAAQPLSMISNIQPLETVQDNIVATYSVLEAVRAFSPQSRLVHASSACFYGVPSSEPPLRETDAPAVGHYVYTATKIAADYAVQHYRHIYHLDCLAARMVNVYGPGEMHMERIVPRLTLQALRGEAPTLTQSDGNDVLSFLYVDDAVTALSLLATRPEASGKAVWNIGGSPPLSIIELMGRVYRLVGGPAESFATVGLRRGAPVHKYLDGTMIKAKLGFSPSVDLDSGLRRTIDWYRQNAESMESRWEKVRNARA